MTKKRAGDSMTEKTTAVILAIVMTSMFAFSGCKTEKAATDKYISGADFSSEASFMAAENDRLLLEWNDERLKKAVKNGRQYRANTSRAGVQALT